MRTHGLQETGDTWRLSSTSLSPSDRKQEAMQKSSFPVYILTNAHWPIEMLQPFISLFKICL